MTEPTQTVSDAHSIRRLTLAVWMLCVLVVIDICVSLYGTVSLYGALLPSRALYEDQPWSVVGELAGFHEWPLEEQIDKATVIAIARYDREDGKRKCVFSEILKQEPGTTFSYK